MQKLDFGKDGEMILRKIEASLVQTLMGKASLPILDETDSPGLNRVIELTNMLSENLSEASQFARALASGNLETDLPGRRNYLAAPLKELHAQLSSITWTAEQLAKGHVVGRLDFMGELSDSMNVLIAKFAGKDGALEQEGNLTPMVSSWQFHQLLLTLNHLSGMVIIADADLKILFMNVPARQYFGPLEKLRPSTARNIKRLEQVISAHNSEENTFPYYSEVQEKKRGTWYRVKTEYIQYPQGMAFLHTVDDISEWKITETQLIKTATTDALTGVYNRNYAIKEMESAIANKGKGPSCIAFIDIDRLKQINDTHGHAEGDYAIQTIARAFATSLRGTDSVSRIGGDEFLLVFADCTMEVAEKVIGRVTEKIQQINQLGGKPYSISFSYGITQIDEHSEETVKDLIQLTDKKMYERKRKKREEPEPDMG